MKCIQLTNSEDFLIVNSVSEGSSISEQFDLTTSETTRSVDTEAGQDMKSQGSFLKFIQVYFG